MVPPSAAVASVFDLGPKGTGLGLKACLKGSGAVQWPVPPEHRTTSRKPSVFGHADRTSAYANIRIPPRRFIAGSQEVSYASKGQTLCLHRTRGIEPTLAFIGPMKTKWVSRIKKLKFAEIATKDLTLLRKHGADGDFPAV